MSIYVVFIVILSIELAQSQSCTFDRGVDRPGAWYANVVSILSAEACCALCQNEGIRCQSWIFVSPGTITAPGCYLRQNIPPINEASACGQFCISGIKESSLVLSGPCAFPGGAYELAVDRPGSTYATLTSVRTHPQCCAMCQLEGSKCQSWTFVRDGALGRSGGCFLKNQVAPISSTPCVPCTSGKK